MLDEPTAQLDPLAKKKFIDTVLELNRDFGITIMCVEHNLADIYSKVDRVLVLEDGKLIYNNTPQKTAECLVKTENPLVYGLPSSVGIQRFQLKMCFSDTLRILQMYLKISALI